MSNDGRNAMRWTPRIISKDNEAVPQPNTNCCSPKPSEAADNPCYLLFGDQLEHFEGD